MMIFIHKIQNYNYVYNFIKNESDGNFDGLKNAGTVLVEKGAEKNESTTFLILKFI